MDMYSPLCCYAMHPGDLFAIRKSGNGVIRCLEGNVLVSMQDCATDFSLSAGMELAIPNNPLVLIESCGNARIAFCSTPGALRRWWLLPGLLLLAVVGIARAFAGTDLPVPQDACPHVPVSSASRDLADREARVEAWRAGKGMLDPGGVPATNRVIAAYESQSHEDL